MLVAKTEGPCAAISLRFNSNLCKMLKICGMPNNSVEIFVVQFTFHTLLRIWEAWGLDWV